MINEGRLLKIGGFNNGRVDCLDADVWYGRQIMASVGQFQLPMCQHFSNTENILQVFLLIWGWSEPQVYLTEDRKMY